MPDNSKEVAILIADISGSTPLYESLGNDKAVQLVSECLARLRQVLNAHSGTFIRSKGDDVLGVFSHPSHALSAARNMLTCQLESELDIHIGLHFGEIVEHESEIFGDPVNVTARLASMAKPGEMLSSDNFVNRISSDEQLWFYRLDNISLKGKTAPTDVYTLLVDDDANRTKIVLHGDSRMLGQHQNIYTTMLLKYADETYRRQEGEVLNIGRAENCDLIIAKPWVSRNHAAITLRQGKIELEDRSSSGTYVSTQDSYELFLHRDSVLLTGSGIISPALAFDDREAQLIHYTVK